MWVSDTTLAKEHEALMEENLKNAVRIDKHNKPIYSIGQPIKKVSCLKRLNFNLSRSFSALRFFLSVSPLTLSFAFILNDV